MPIPTDRTARNSSTDSGGALILARRISPTPSFHSIRRRHRVANVTVVVFRTFPIDHDETLVTGVNQHSDLLLNFRNRQIAPNNSGVGRPESAVRTVVYAGARYVERSEQNDAIAVNRLLDPVGRLEDRFPEFGIVSVRQSSDLRGRQQFPRRSMGSRFLDDIEDGFSRRTAGSPSTRRKSPIRQ